MKLLAFSLEPCGRGSDCGQWARVHTLRETPDGGSIHRMADVRWELGLRMADQLAERYGVQDTSGLYAGRVHIVRETYVQELGWSK